jgi:hypothetical protein
MERQEPDFEALSSAVASVRALVTHLRRTTADPETLAAVEREVRALNERLAPHDYAGPFAQRQLFVDPGSMGPARDTDDPVEYFPYSPVIGPLNPVAPPVDFQLVGRELHATHVFDPQYNGPPMSVHGGVVALVFDELLGSLGAVLDIGGFTGTLEVVYRSLTPLDQPVRMRSWIEGEEGSKVFIHGTMHTTDPGSEERLCAQARGIFIRPKQGMLAHVLEHRGGTTA